MTSPFAVLIFVVGAAVCDASSPGSNAACGDDVSLIQQGRILHKRTAGNEDGKLEDTHEGHTDHSASEEVMHCADEVAVCNINSCPGRMIFGQAGPGDAPAVAAAYLQDSSVTDKDVERGDGQRRGHCKEQYRVGPQSAVEVVCTRERIRKWLVAKKSIDNVCATCNCRSKAAYDTYRTDARDRLMARLDAAAGLGPPVRRQQPQPQGPPPPPAYEPEEFAHPPAYVDQADQEPQDLPHGDAPPEYSPPEPPLGPPPGYSPPVGSD